jgi:hypothetical protein
MDEDEQMTLVSHGESKDDYIVEIAHPKKSKGVVLIVTLFGKRSFMEYVIADLKHRDMFDDDNGTISVEDARGTDVLGVDYELPEGIGDPDPN